MAAAARAGALGVLDLSVGDQHARDELALAAEWIGVPFGVRLAADSPFTQQTLPSQASVILLPAGATLTAFADRQVLVEVTDLDQARRAAAGGAQGLIARGHEAGGRVGELSTYVLLQQLINEGPDLPVWAWGGIGPRTAVASVIGGATGVVLDTQLALLAEAELPTKITNALAGLDGSETMIIDGRRVLQRRGPQAESADPLPIGQDSFLAARFQREFGTVGRAVREIRDTIIAALDPAPASPADFGTELPIAQGPMTRVSDQAAFATAVAGAGALPFIALALSGPAQTRTVLEQTRDAIGDASWGVGVLGFADEEIKSAQLEVIREVRPTHAIIAGGRPSQAAALEDVGISTFLHVPSPGLLKQFLDAGARKFIFEGAECGGHVGPRNSFPLWEAQLGVLDDFLAESPEAAAELQVFFAGGIHDERSAAMVTAMAEPLSRHGASVGVLMGTAYLLTREAVEAGAIGAQFQQQVLTARTTDLLETAPGHATRCVRSPFTTEYAAIKQDLQDRQVPSREAWEQLEQLNVGRLRLASKGIERVGDDLQSVTEDRQLAEGMFMAGEVAVLRGAETTLAELHAAVTTGAAEFLTARAEELRNSLTGDDTEQLEPEPLDIAIVGMSCMFPDAPDLGAFWANVLSGKDSVTEVPADRWDPELYFSEGGGPGQTPSRWGGFLPEIGFDPLKYGIPPASLASIEPVQLLALEVAQRALVDAGYENRAFDRSRTSVIFGAEAGSDLSNATTLRTVLPSYVGELPAELDDQLPRLTEDSFPGMLANVIAGRIANRLDLGGANYTVDAACASSLTAVDVACKELTSGTSDLVLCGGADLHNGIHDYLLFASVQALSATGRSATFDSSGDGIALGEGVACIALKRRVDAERDGDRIYAVIKGVGSASDGRALGLTAPRPEGQRTALQRAYRHAGISPAEVGLVEAHGTGTVVGDRTELNSLTRVFTEAEAPAGQCTLGSVKSQIGHTKCAAGLAGLIKSTLALHTGVKPPTLHVKAPNAAWDVDTSPFTFNAAPSPWAAHASDRIAGVSAFGFGGTNFHVVLKGYEAPPPRHASDQWPVELFCFRTAQQAGTLLNLVEADPGNGQPWRLRDLALAASRRYDQGTGSTTIAVLASSTDELGDLLRRALAGDDAPGIFRPDSTPDTSGEIALLFPGQGSQRPGMFADLFVAFPELSRLLRHGTPETVAALFPPVAFDDDQRVAQRARLTDTRLAQPALGLTGLAAHRLLERAGVRASMMAGHSYGELVALSAAGSLSAEALLACSTARAEAILEATGSDDPGTMAAVSADSQQVAAALEAAGLTDQVVIANRNSPNQTVISGPTDAVDAAVPRLRDAGLAAKRIPVACAFHSPLVAAGGARFGETLTEVEISPPRVPVWANRTAGTYPSDAAGIRAELSAQLGSPVGFVEQIEAMYHAGARVFVEAGPGTVLTRLVGAILGDRPHQRIAFEGDRRTGLAGFLAAVARLAVAGAEVSTGWLFAGRDAVDALQNSRAQRPGWTVNGHLVRTAAGAPAAKALQPARRLQTLTTNPPIALEPTMSAGQHSPQQPAGAGSSADALFAGGNTEALIAEFLRNSREMIAAQRDVLLSYLGTAPAQPTVHFASPAALPAPLLEQTPLPEPVQGPANELILSPSTSSGNGEASSGNGQMTAESVMAAILEVIADRTGYPVDMIEPDLDLETDLSVDSIKRTEIAGELASRLDLPMDGDLEQLSQARTAAKLTALIMAGSEQPETEQPEIGADPEPTIPQSEPEVVEAVSARSETAPVIIAPKRLIHQEFELEHATVDAGQVAGRTFLIIGYGEVAAELRTGLAALDAKPITVSATEAISADLSSGDIDGVFYLDQTIPVLPDSFELFQAVLARQPRWLIAAGPADGLRGFFRTVAREYPDMITRVVEHIPSADSKIIADGLLAELSAVDHEPVVVRSGTTRRGLRLAETGLGLVGSSGAGPAGDGAAEAAALGIDRDSVILLVGGAKGITARLALALATASHCRIEIFGRTPLCSVAEESVPADLLDRAAIRSALIASGGRTPAEIERATAEIISVREVRDTIDRIEAAGSPVRYRSIDVRDREAVQHGVKEIHAEFGRLDGVVYAAGVIEDKLIMDKTGDSFHRVYTTKVDGAQALLDATQDLPRGPRFAVLFGSIAAALGNRGQADYASANDALEQLGRRWASADRRGLTVHWGPWAPSGRNDGMVTPALMRNYAERGIALIDPEEGPFSLLRELAWGDTSVDAVVYSASGW